MIDVLISTVPWTDDSRPLLAPAVLKPCVELAGFTCRTLDLNAEVYNHLKNHPHRTKIIDFFLMQKIHDESRDCLYEILDRCAKRIIDEQPRILALSLLSQDCQFFTWWLCYHLRFLAPDIKIVIGGSGVKNFIAQPDFIFAKELRAAGIIDDFILGDGEKSIVEYLKGNTNHPGINNDGWQQIDDLDSLPFADFSDYDFSQYQNAGIPICDSRGCVRSCEFCDIIEHWKKYKYRSAENIWNEMQQQINTYGIHKFFFYNSLTNGNMKEFSKLLDFICDYNSSRHKTDQISWEGYFIVRNARQHPEILWEKLKKSNANLMLGIESVVEHVRVGLGKNFTNQDIDHHLEMAKKYEIPLMLLMIIGYPTETKADYEFTKQWFRDRAHYAGMPIDQVVCTLSAILPNTELDRNQDKYNIVKGDIPVFWFNQALNITEQDRKQHLDDLQALLAEIGMVSNTDQLTRVLVENDQS